MRVGIIGAGTMGLTLAYRLGKAGHEVVVFEAAPQVGGLGTWFDYGEFVWDKYYHVILPQDSHLLGLIDELGVSSRLNWVETKTGFLWHGRHISMSSSWDFFRFPLLNPIEKLRLAAGILYVQRITNPAPLEQIKVADWMTRVFGARVYQRIWEPLVRSKYGVLTDRMPATIMWATIRRYYATRRKGSGKEQMGFLSEGLRSLYQGLVQAITKQGGRIRCATTVEKVDDSRPSGVGMFTSGAFHEVDRVISTVPTKVLQEIAPDLPDHCRGNGKGPEYLGIVCLALVLRRPLNPFYVTNLIHKGFPFTGIIGLSNLSGAERLGGHHLVMLPRYEVPESSWFAKSQDQVATEFISALRPHWPDINDNLIRWYLSRDPLVQALWIANPPPASQPRMSQSQRVWNINAELAGRDTLNNNAIINVATEIAKQAASSLRIN